MGCTMLGELVKWYEFAGKRQEIRFCCGTVITVPYTNAQQIFPNGSEYSEAHALIFYDHTGFFDSRQFSFYIRDQIMIPSFTL